MRTAKRPRGNREAVGAAWSGTSEPERGGSLNKKLEARFEEIAQQAIEDAEAVKCDGPVFVEGLRIILSAVKHRWEGARDEFGDND